MPRLIAILITATALAAIAFSASAGAATTTCIGNAPPKVAGGSVTGVLTSSNVNKVQARFATCGHAKKVMSKVIGLGLEEPRSVKAFYCRPTVVSTNPESVRYTCTFKGADTAMFVKLTFSVVYEG